jgi:hypothetical protein
MNNTPLSINAFFNAKTLDYQRDNQAFVHFRTPQYLSIIGALPHLIKGVFKLIFYKPLQSSRCRIVRFTLISRLILRRI